MSVAKVNTKIFPFTVNRTSMGLTSLWLHYKPKDLTWSDIECTVVSPTSVIFTPYSGFGFNQEKMCDLPTNVRKDLLAPYIETRKQQIVNEVFRAEEKERERIRIETRKREIFKQLFEEHA